MYAPGLLSVIGTILKYLGLVLVALLALSCVVLVSYCVYNLSRSLFGQVLRRPSGAAALAVLCTLYFGALFAPFLAPYPMAKQNLSSPYHPPSGLVWEDGGLQVKLYEKAESGSSRYKQREGDAATAPLRFLVKAEPYRLLGLIPLEHKFSESRATIRLLDFICSEPMTQGEIFLVVCCMDPGYRSRLV